MLLAFSALSSPTDPPVVSSLPLQYLPSSASCVCPPADGMCGYDRLNPCLGGTCIPHGTKDWTCVCLPNHRFQGRYCDQKWEAVSSITVVGSDWRCKDVYTVYGLTLQQFTDMNPGIDYSALLPQVRELVVKELLPACSAFYYVQPNDTCSSVAQFLSITEESLQQLNPGVSCSSRLLAFRSLCVERDTAKAKPSCENRIKIDRVVDFKQVAASNGATMVDLCRLNPWISFRDSLRDIDYLCVSARYSTPTPSDTTAPASNTTAPSSNTTAPSSNTTAPASNTTAPASNTKAPASNTTAPASNTTAPASNTTAPASNTTAPASNTTAPANTTVPASNTTAPSSNTTAPASNTTTPSEYPDAESSSTLVITPVNDTCSSVAQFLSITKESLQQLNPGVSCSSRLLAFRSLCLERDPAKAKPRCVKKIKIGRVEDFKQVAASNGATMVDLCRLNPWISFRNSMRDTDYVSLGTSIASLF
ncbi:unnamed protein product [Closterium sp. Naga37s-1]|nr:unnamed protein product [Closterium sp. Naga37s-1]